MPKVHSITANGNHFTARTGDVILDSALMQGVEFPHDCRAGRCGSCLARVLRGVTLGGETLQRGMVHACQARAVSDLELQFDKLPPVQSVRAQVSSLTERGSDVIEVGLKLSEPIPYRPGQYCTFKFRGFPQRCFSPTHPADGSHTDDDITLHVKRVRGGRVSNALGRKIKPGHRLRIEGPFGAAFYRRNVANRLVLIAGGTGFAPILSIATAALADDPARAVELVVGTRTIQSLYMIKRLVKLERHPGVNLTVTASELPALSALDAFIQRGGPAEHLPELLPDDTVYAAGAPAMIKRIATLVDQVGADFYSDPFERAGNASAGWVSRALAWPLRRLAA
jgi:NAD(P)H-flavin reductase